MYTRGSRIKSGPILEHQKQPVALGRVVALPTIGKHVDAPNLEDQMPGRASQDGIHVSGNATRVDPRQGGDASRGGAKAARGAGGVGSDLGMLDDGTEERILIIVTTMELDPTAPSTRGALPRSYLRGERAYVAVV